MNALILPSARVTSLALAKRTILNKAPKCAVRSDGNVVMSPPFN